MVDEEEAAAVAEAVWLLEDESLLARGYLFTTTAIQWSPTPQQKPCSLLTGSLANCEKMDCSATASSAVITPLLISRSASDGAVVMQFCSGGITGADTRGDKHAVASNCGGCVAWVGGVTAAAGDETKEDTVDDDDDEDREKRGDAPVALRGAPSD